MGRTREAVQNDIDAQVEYLFSHSFNHTLHAYIDITGDLVAGTLLSQIMYWFSESANKGIRARIYKDGHYWIAKRREDWMQEIRISKKQYDCAIKKLTTEGNALVEVKKYQFNGTPVTHIRPITENINRVTDKWKSDLAESIAAQYNNGCNGSLPKGNMEVPQRETSNYPKGEYGSLPKGDMEVYQRETSNYPKGEYGILPKGNMEVPQRDSSYTENTTENTAEITAEKNILLGRPNDTPDSPPSDAPVKPKRSKKPKPASHPEEVKQIIEYFNRVCGTHYKYQSEATASMINARLNDGFTVEDFYRVIDTKHAEWEHNPDMYMYVRPQTLFRPSHFENYLNQKSTPPQESTNGVSEEMAVLYRACVVESNL